tara:strand:+ start:431 stop:1000 length:570 start_codon:yes stop_codon:yes gene_type:complete
MVVPEEWAKYLRYVGDSLKTINDQFATRMESVARETRENSERIGGMTETYLELHSALDDRDAEIKRLKAGYDAEIFRKYIRRFVSIEREVDEFMAEDSEIKSMQYLKRLFADAFDECGVSRFAPAVGEDYRAAWGVADHPEKVQTEELEKDFQVAEVVEEGYQLSNENGRSLIVEAKVNVYHYLNQGEK